MIPLGTYSTLTAKRQLLQGIYLEDAEGDEVLLPNKYIPNGLQLEDEISVFVYTDSEDRIIATTIKPKILLDLLIAEPTDLGVNVIINNRHRGLIFRNEIFQNLELGDRVKGYIKKIRQDNRIDVSLQPQGLKNIEPSAAKILDYLKRNQGFMSLTDKSRPEEIMAKMEMSKKSFKKGLGNLYKQKLVRLEKNGTYLV